MNNRSYKEKNSWIKNIVYWVIIFIACCLISLSFYLKNNFGSSTFIQLLYSLTNAKHLNVNTLEESIMSVVFSTFILISICLIPFIFELFANVEWSVMIRKKKRTILPVPLKTFSIFLLVLSLIFSIHELKLVDYVLLNLSNTKIYEEYYVPYQKENVIFPEEKRNLIYIFLESYESSNFSKENGGIYSKTHAPNLEKLAQEKTNIHFSNNNKLGGFYEVNGANWTVASMVGQTAGIPIFIRTKNKKNHFLEGAVSLGDILKENGYENYLLIGSNAEFGDRKKYFTDHGNYTIMDDNYARKNRDIPQNYYNWWGYEDEKLYQIAKQKLTKISSSETPFNFTMLTADTHFIDGFLEDSCPTPFSTQYENTFYCTDKMLTEFLNWIQSQDFYQNTTIVIVGDHLTMRSNYYQLPNHYNRTVFNLILNSKIETTNTKNRTFTAFDMFPTTLASLGVEIKENRLALGTNLFSERPTIPEQLGYEKFNKEIQKKSNYYQTKILKSLP